APASALDEGEGIETEVVDERRPGDPGHRGDDHPGDEQEQQYAHILQRRVGRLHGAVVVLAAGSLRVGDHADREDRGQAGAESESHNEHLEDAFQISHRRFLWLGGNRRDQTAAVGLASFETSRTSAGTTELVEESQSALTLLLSTFCFWARHQM